MPLKPAAVGRSRRTRAVAVLATLGVALAATAALSGFHAGVRELDDSLRAAGSELTTTEVIGIRTLADPVGVRVTADVVYGTSDDGTVLTLDVCSPERPREGPQGTAAELPAVVSVHGGSWARGDKANDDWRLVCRWLASEGFVAYSVNYRLLPDSPFPAAIDDVALAVEWLRTPAHAERFGIDPQRVGALGGSAGGNLAALLGTRGAGALTEGSRVMAVAELSAPIDLRRDAVVADGGNELLQGIIARYLGCQDWSRCPQAGDASPSSHLDASDPPFFIGHAEAEFVPLAQATGFATALEHAGLRVELAVVPGEAHSIGILDEDMRERVAAFLHTELG